MQQHKEKFENFLEDLPVSKACDEAGFIRNVSPEQFVVTIHDIQLAGYGCTSSCREYASPRYDQGSTRKGLIQGNTRIGPVLEVMVTESLSICGQYGEETEFIVDSSASVHMTGKNDLTSEEQESLAVSRQFTTVVTANGTKRTTKQTTVLVKDLDMFVTFQLPEDSPAAVSLGNVFERRPSTKLTPCESDNFVSRRDEKGSKTKGWIRGNTQIRPASEVKVTNYLERDGIEIKIDFMRKDATQSWIVISRGLDKYVTELPEVNKKPIHFEEAPSSTGKLVAMRQKEQFIPSSPSSSSTIVPINKW